MKDIQSKDVTEARDSNRKTRAALAAVFGIPVLLFIVIELPFILQGIYGLSTAVTRTVTVIAGLVVLAAVLWPIVRSRR
jgi:hypothetical protein